MTLIIVMSVVSVCAFFVTALRVVNVRTLLRFHVFVDVGFTLGMLYFFAGTITGALVAVMGGLFMALTLSALRAYLKAMDKMLNTLPSEFDAAGNWIYNSPRMIRGLNVPV